MGMDLQKIDNYNFGNIITKQTNEVGFRVIDQNKLQKISDQMPEVDRALSVFSKTNSQTSATLMTLNMIDNTPLTVIRQIMAQVEKKRTALKEALYKNENKKIRIKKLKKQIQEDENLTELEIDEIDLKISKLGADINDSVSYIEASIKEIGAYLDRYNEIKINNNIPDDWDELMFEEAEVEHHIKAIFREAIKDRMSGPTNNGTMEYMEQFGIEPILGYAYVDNFIIQVRDGIEKGMDASIEMRYKFYHDMYLKFKDEYKKALKNIGVNSATYDEWLLRGNNS